MMKHSDFPRLQQAISAMESALARDAGQVRRRKIRPPGDKDQRL